MQGTNVEQKQKKAKTKKRKTKKEIIRRGIITGVTLIGSLVLIDIGFSWYSRGRRNAESESAKVMKPYNLYLMNSSETDVLQLSVGNLMLGETKQIVFSVSNYEYEDDYNFEYAIELIHTDNLALDYMIYELEKSDKENATIITEDVVTKNGTAEEYITYWCVNTDNVALSGTDVSDERQAEVELTGDEVNAGTYIMYENTGTNELQLSSVDGGHRSQYFLMEIEWDESAYTDFDKYEKETDMIYIVVKAVQPEPEVKE